MSSFRLAAVLMFVMCIVPLARADIAFLGTASRHSLATVAPQNIEPASTSAHPQAWWSDRFAGFAGGWMGGVMGLEGAVIGILGSRGEHPRLVAALMVTNIAIGLALLMVGLIAVCLHQSFAVYYPLLLCGFLHAALYGGLIRVARRRRQQIELRKIHAMDAS